MKAGLPWGQAFARLLLGAALAAFAGVAGAATYYARVATGDWNVASTWSTVAPGGAAAASVPGSGDDVVIERFSTTSPQITIPAGYGANVKNVRVGNSGQAGGVSLTLAASNSSLTIGDSLTIYPPNDAATNALNVNAGTVTVAKNFTFESGTGTARMQITTGTATSQLNLELKGATAARNVIDMSGGAGTLNISDQMTITTATLTPGTTSTVNFNRSGNQTVPIGVSSVAYANLTLSGSGTKTPTAGTGSLAGNFTLSSGVTWAGNSNNPVINIAGNFTNNGTFNSGTGTYTFNGSAGQTITGTASGTTTFARLALNNASGLSLTGTHNVTVSTLLTLTSGRITTNANILYISNGSAIASVGASDFVVGNLRKHFAVGGDVTRVFEVGSDATGVRYAPVDIRFGSVGTAGYFTVSSTAGDHASIASSTLDATQSANRYWTLTNNTVDFSAVANNRIIFTFVAGDLDAGADTTTFYISRFVSPNWTELTPSARTATTTTISGTGITTANISGDYQIGEQAPAVPTPGSFNVFEASTGAGQITGVIKTRIAGSAFSLDVVAISSGAQLNGFTSQVTVELLGNNTLGVALDANNCPTSFSSLQTVSPDPTITGGRSTVNFAAVADSWRDVRVRVRYPTSSPTVTSCSTDNFAIRPNTFASVAVTDQDWQAAGTSRTLNDVTITAPASGGLVHKAGRPFSVRATAVNAAGSPATTTNYSGTPSVTRSSCGGAACTASFGTFTLGAGFSAGQLASDVATYDNVGSLRVQLVDSTFATVDGSDGSTAAERDITSSAIDVGRFVPDHFAITSSSITPRTDIAGCSGSSFTYLGERMDTALTLEARNSSGAVTSNYAGTLGRLDLTNAASYNFGAIDSTVPTLLTGRLTTLPATGSWTAGVATATAPISINRNAAPDGPFASVKVGIAPSDLDGVTLGTFNLDADNSGSNERGQVGANTALRFGRLRLENAVGSEKMDLPIPIQTQYWAGTAFQINPADNCTLLSAANIQLGSYHGGIDATNMNGANVSLGAAFSAGFGSLTLTKPSPVPGSSGAVTLTVNLTAEAKSYLKGNWGVSTFTADPTSRAAFGLYGSQPSNFIYFRENY